MHPDEQRKKEWRAAINAADTYAQITTVQDRDRIAEAAMKKADAEIRTARAEMELQVHEARCQARDHARLLASIRAAIGAPKEANLLVYIKKFVDVRLTAKNTDQRARDAIERVTSPTRARDDDQAAE